MVNFDPKRAAAVTCDFYSPEGWREQQLGPYATGRKMPAEFAEFFASALTEAKAFRALLERPNNHHLLIVASRRHQTLATLGKRDGKWSFDSAEKELGDGRVRFTHAMPHDGVSFDVLETNESHADLLNDPLVMARLLED